MCLYLSETFSTKRVPCRSFSNELILLSKRQQISITIPGDNIAARKFGHKIKADKYLKTHITNNYFRGLVALVPPHRQSYHRNKYNNNGTRQ